MIGSIWHTATADLALILFLVVAAAGIDSDGAHEAARPASTATMPIAPPAGIYRPQSATSLGDWLDGQDFDERQIATVIVRQPRGGPSRALDQGIAYLSEIETAGRSGRLLVEKGAREEVLVVLAYDGLRGAGTAFAAQ